MDDSISTSNIQMQQEQKWLVFDLVDQCNLTCPSCYRGIHGNASGKMSIENAKRMLDHLFIHFSFDYIMPYSWSEPFLCKNLPDFIELFAQYPAKLHLSSNLNLPLKEDDLRRILPHLTQLRLSATGLDQESYEVYHRNGKIEKVLKNMELLSKIRQETDAQTEFVWMFGRTLYNGNQEQKIRDFCNQNGWNFDSYTYYLTDVKDLYKVYNNEPISPETYEVLYPSYEALREQLLSKLTPKRCPFLSRDIVVDTNMNLMTCCTTDISLNIPVTSITSTEELISSRLKNPFCKKCFEIGLCGLFWT